MLWREVGGNTLCCVLRGTKDNDFEGEDGGSWREHSASAYIAGCKIDGLMD